MMTLYAIQNNLLSHRIRIILAEKAVKVKVIMVHQDRLPENFLQINPYGNIPTLVDKDLVLNHSCMTEYLDERYPHPPLLPVYPIARAKARMMVYRIEQDWYKYADRIMRKKDVDASRLILKEILLKLTPIFADSPYFLSTEFSLIDCTLAPLLWRLDTLGITLPESAKPILDYAQSIFNREGFQMSLSEDQSLGHNDILDEL